MIYEAIDRWNSPDSYLEHFGVKGMRWGHRKQERYQRRYAKYLSDSMLNGGNSRSYNRLKKIDSKYRKANGQNSISMKAINKNGQKYVELGFKGTDTKYSVSKDAIAKITPKSSLQNKKKGLTKGQKIAIGVGVGAAVAVGVGVGAYALHKNGKLPLSKATSMFTKENVQKVSPLRSSEVAKAEVSKIKIEMAKVSRASVPTTKLASTGFAKNVTRGRSTVRNINLHERNMRDYKLANARKAQNLAFNNWFNNGPRNMSMAKGSPREINSNLLRKSGVAAENFVRVNSQYGLQNGANTYRPLYTTKSGRKITKLLRSR